MPQIGTKYYLKVLSRLQENAGQVDKFYDQTSYTVRLPDDEPEVEYNNWSEDDRLVVRLAIEKGLIRSRSFCPDYEDPQWKQTDISLTAAGNDFVNRHSESWWRKALGNIRSNIATIMVSVLTALLISWALAVFGPH